MRSGRLSALLLASVLSGCAGSYQVVQLPQREADLYPLSQSQAGVTIAVDEIRNADRSQRYFGTNLAKRGILPLAIIVSNYGKHRVMTRPADVLLHRGTEIIDPLPLATVARMAKDEHWFLREKTEKELDRYLDGIAFKETTILPNESYQGVMFFGIPKPKESSDTFFTILRLFQDSGMKVRVGVTNLETNTRVRFGPFGLSLPEDS